MSNSIQGYIKDMVYKKSRSLTDLKRSIITVFHTLNTGLCKNVCKSEPERLQQCIDADEYQFEHFNYGSLLLFFLILFDVRNESYRRIIMMHFCFELGK